MNDSTATNGFSVQVTVQRTTTEYGFVSVLVTPDMAGDDGKLDADKLFNYAVKSATNPKMKWHLEDTKLDLSPIQKADKN